MKHIIRLAVGILTVLLICSVLLLFTAFYDFVRPALVVVSIIVFDYIVGVVVLILVNELKDLLRVCKKKGKGDYNGKVSRL